MKDFSLSFHLEISIIKRKIKEPIYDVVIFLCIVCEFSCLFLYRVKGMLSNFGRFSEAFNCPVGSAMNPVDKCVMF